jgi:dihydroorotase
LPFAEAEVGASGLELLLPLTLKWAEAAGVALPTALARITCDPAAILGIAGGELSPGAPADVCVFDPEAIWQPGADTLRSEGKNTPFIGGTMQGRVRTTLVGGRVVFGG